MFRAALTFGAAVLTSGTPSPFTHKEPTPVGDHVVLRTAEFPTCGHVEYKTNFPSMTKHLIQIFDCDGHPTTTDAIEVQFPDLNDDWAVYNGNGGGYLWPELAGRQGGFVMCYIDNSLMLHTVLFDSNGGELSNVVEYVDPVQTGMWAPSVAMLTGGGFIVGWDTAISYVSRVSVYEADGTRSIHAEEIATFGNRVRVAALADGGWVSTYSARDAVFATMQPLGGARTSFQVSQTATAEEVSTGKMPGYSHLATLTSTGGFAVTWLYRQDELYIRFYDAAGNPTSGMTRLRHSLNTAADDQQHYYDLSGIGAGGWGEGFVVSWVESPSTPAGFVGTVVREYSSSGRLLESYDLPKGSLRPNVYSVSAGYSINFFSVLTGAVSDTENFFATCATLVPHTATCPVDQETLPLSTSCTNYPCNLLESCCVYPSYGVKQDGVDLAGNFVGGSDSVAAGGQGQGGLSLVQLPDLYRQMDAFFPSSGVVGQGTEFEVRCGTTAMCSFLVVVYHCPPCSKGHNLGFPSTLPLAGWSAGSCAPKFEVNGQGYPMTAFKLDVAYGEKVTLPATETGSEYVAVFGTQTALPDQWCQKGRGPSFNGAGGCHSCL